MERGLSPTNGGLVSAARDKTVFDQVPSSLKTVGLEGAAIADANGSLVSAARDPHKMAHLLANAKQIGLAEHLISTASNELITALVSFWRYQLRARDL